MKTKYRKTANLSDDPGETSKSTYEKFYKKCEDFLKTLLKENLPENSQVFLFGSRARGDNSRNADIDIGVLSPKIDSKIIIKIREIIEESFVPFKVDIVDFSEVNKTFKNEALRSAIRWI